ncbi:MAG: beta-lactamase family protein [Acetatifactor sp.]|nr:beta-lactamase family protein [Acetatifactor sp.]
MGTLPSKERGISPDVLLALLDRLQQTHIPLHSLHILHHGKTELEAYYAPCRKGQLHRMFSISKSLTALAVLKLYETGHVLLEASICRYFPEYVNENTHPWIRQTTVRDMLMMRSCHASTTYKFDMARDWVESYFTTPPTHKPGTVFHYDTSASHTLCALVEKLTGQPMLDYLKDTMLQEIGWSEESYMLADPFGHSMGGSGLMATAEDLVLLGRLLMQGGRWKGRTLLSEDLLTEALSWQSATAVTGPITGESQGYGYFFWCGEQDARICYGMGGQLILCYPAHELLVVTTADTQGMNGANQLIYDAVRQILLPGLSDYRSSVPQEELRRRVLELCIEPLCSVYSQGCSSLFRNHANVSGNMATNAVNFLDARTDGARIQGLVYRIQGCGSFIELSLELSSESGFLHYTLNGADYCLPFGLYQVIPCRFPGYDMFCASSGMWLDEHTFYIRTHLLDTSVGSVHFQLYFGENDVTVFMKKQEETLFGEYNGHLYGIAASDD